MSLNWKPMADRMTADLEDCFSDPAVRQAFANTPRHLFIPAYLQHWADPSTGTDGWTPADEPDPEEIYSNQVLVTQVRPDPTGRVVPTCSSSQPSLMAEMIRHLDIRPGMKVLEIGTGTGYNAAILCHLLGDENVTTIDIDPELTEQAKTRLASIGYRPAFEPTPQTYDRVLATCAVDAIPPDWVTWSKPGGVILADLRAMHIPTYLGAWATLTADEESKTATGVLSESRGHFMGLRTRIDQAPGHKQAPTKYTDMDRLRKRSAIYGISILSRSAFEFFLWRHLPQAVWAHIPNDLPAGEQRNITTLDGRWAAVSEVETAYFTPDDLWGEIELAYDKWMEAGKPDIDAYRIEVDLSGATLVELQSRS